MAKRRLKYTIDEVRHIFENEGYMLLTQTYINNLQKLRYICPNGHVNQITLSKFNQGRRCKICAYVTRNMPTKLKYNYVKKYIDSIGYTLISDKYINNNSKINVRCDKGHEYSVRFLSLQSGRRCKICMNKQHGINSRHTYEYVKAYIEQTGYTLLSTEYNTARDKLKIKCNKGHEYNVQWYHFQQGSRCPHCNPMYSKAEKQVAEFVSQFVEIDENNRTILNGRELDVYVPSKQLAIEYCGLYWHNDAHLPRNYHRTKLDECTAKGIRLITIFEDEWLDNPDICKSRIKHALGVQSNRLYARKCTIQELTPKQANEFYRANHLQGATRGKLHLGLFHDATLVQAMTIGELSRMHVAKRTLEVKRMSNLIGYSVVGGASKLFKYIRKYTLDNGYNYIRSYADLRWGTGGVYEQLGFSEVTRTKYTPHYVLGQSRFRNQGLRKTPEERLTGKTEWQLRSEQGYTRIWDCGHNTYDHSLLTEQWQKTFKEVLINEQRRRISVG